MSLVIALYISLLASSASAIYDARAVSNLRPESLGTHLPARPLHAISALPRPSSLPSFRLSSKSRPQHLTTVASSSSSTESVPASPDRPHIRADIVVLPGDGIGPEIVAEAVRVLEAVGVRFGHDFRFHHHLIGAAALDVIGSPLPQATVAALADADAVLLGAVGDPRYSGPDVAQRPEQGLLQLRQRLGVYANLRPVSVHPDLMHLSKIKMDVPADIMFVRELTGGIYFGRKETTATSATDVCTYHDHEIRRVVRQAATLARARRGRLVSIDKANVLETSRLWRRIADEVVGSEFPDVHLEHMLVDAAAMHLIAKPAYFDVVVTENMFGDILTDLASMLGGSLGLLPSASVDDSGRGGLYEPIHGSAPDIAGQNIANPYATILSAAMMLRMSLGLGDEAEMVERAVNLAISEGVLPRDIAPAGAVAYSTTKIGDEVISRLFD